MCVFQRSPDTVVTADAKISYFNKSHTTRVSSGIFPYIHSKHVSIHLNCIVCIISHFLWLCGSRGMNVALHSTIIHSISTHTHTRAEMLLIQDVELVLGVHLSVLLARRRACVEHVLLFSSHHVTIIFIILFIISMFIIITVRLISSVLF